MKLKHGVSYAWMFWAFLLVFFGAEAETYFMHDARPWPLLLFVVFTAFLLFAQVRSKIGLDRAWRAAVTQEMPFFRLYLVVQFLFLIAMIGLLYETLK